MFQNNLAVALERTGHYVASRSAYEAALQADSTYGNAKLGLARVAERRDTAAAEPLDVSAVAQEFAAAVKQWQDTMTARDTMARDTADVPGQER